MMARGAVVEIGAGAATVKALVWFWLIDETLSANLVYQSANLFQVLKQMKIMT